ncbi:MAG: peptidoglycan bridge formation glycyltransferase FemA/FemB family protein [Anaerolineae bacterium]|nr:peptidoglycan bridge formation glycyltransferase FemA/FemB family protein [Anaerolineae bacterium]
MQAFEGTSLEWNKIVSKLPSPHLLQTWEWSQVKANYGWERSPFIWKDGEKIAAAAMILKRRIPIRGFAARLSILYIPKGPLMDWDNESLRNRVLDDLQTFAKQPGPIFLKLDPDVVLGMGVPGEPDSVEDKTGQSVMAGFKQRGWRYSSDQIQFRNTILIDLHPTQEELLARMKQKTRYNVRLASKKGVSIRVGKIDDLVSLYKLYAETSVRDGFVIRDEAYYQTVWKTFMDSSSPTCEPLIAIVEGDPVAAIFVFYFANRAYYLYGMSSAVHREKMATYLLQWEAIKRAKLAGCKEYDLWGAPEAFNESDSMWGVFRFKKGLGGRVIRTLGAWDFTSKPLIYNLYSEVLPRVLGFMRTRGMSHTKQNIGR